MPLTDQNPALENKNGSALDLDPGSAVPAGATGLLQIGTDGSVARAILTDSSGHPVVVGAGTAGTPTGGIVSVQGVSNATAISTVAQTSYDTLSNVTLTSSSAIGIPRGRFGQAKEVVLFIAIAGPVTGTAPELTFTLYDEDQNGSITSSVASATYTSAVTLQVALRKLPFSDRLQLNYTVAGTSPSFGGVSATIASFVSEEFLRDSTLRPVVVGAGTAGTPAGGVVSIQGVSGGQSIPVTNPSVGTNAAAIPTSSTLLGASDGTNLRQLLVESSTDKNLRVGIFAGANQAAVKAASTAAVAADSALVVALSPNNTLPVASPGTSGGTTGQITGDVQTNATTKTFIAATTYAEQTSGAQRSVVSASILDTSAGTGARSVRLTYYTLTSGVIAGPLTETVTLNGILAVNTVATNIAYIEKAEVLTVGSGGSNAGAISIFSLIGGGGSAFVQIAASLNITRLAHHFIPTGKTCHIYDFSIQNDAASGNNPRFTAEIVDITSSVSAERPIITMRIDGRSFGNMSGSIPVSVSGPARIRIYVTPGNNAVQTSTALLRYIEV